MNTLKARVRITAIRCFCRSTDAAESRAPSAEKCFVARLSAAEGECIVRDVKRKYEGSKELFLAVLIGIQYQFFVLCGSFFEFKSVLLSEFKREFFIIYDNILFTFQVDIIFLQSVTYLSA